MEMEKHKLKLIKTKQMNQESLEEAKAGLQ